MNEKFYDFLEQVEYQQEKIDVLTTENEKLKKSLSEVKNANDFLMKVLREKCSKCKLKKRQKKCIKKGV